MTTEKDLKRISKFLSLVLRHKPQQIGLKLDSAGWASVDELITKSDLDLTPELIRQVVANNDKQRFALSDDGNFIRANQGHSVQVDLGLEPAEPPALLFHGTATRFLESILSEGLKPQGRQHVHLSKDMETAVKVGRRHGKPVILQLPAHELHQSGQQFFLARNGVWLTAHVRPDDLIVLD